MRPAAFEIVGVSWSKDPPLVVDRYLEPAREKDATLLASCTSGTLPEARNHRGWKIGFAKQLFGTAILIGLVSPLFWGLSRIRRCRAGLNEM
jgi:hypothetical protein